MIVLPWALAQGDPLKSALDLLSGSGAGIVQDPRSLALTPDYGRSLVAGLRETKSGLQLDADPAPLITLFGHLGKRVNAARDPLEPSLDTMPPEAHVDNGKVAAKFEARPTGFVFREYIQ